MKLAALTLFFLNTIWWGTYYAITKAALQRIDPLIFSMLEYSASAPIALLILFSTRKQINRDVIRGGMTLGCWLFFAFAIITISLQYTSATNAAFFPAMNGFLAAIISWAVLRKPVAPLTWLAAQVSIVGALLLVFDTSVNAGNLGDLIALAGALLFAWYVFQVDHVMGKGALNPWPVLAVEMLTVTCLASVVALLFGDWQHLHPTLPEDAGVIIYIGLIATFLPAAVAVFMQRYVSAVTVAFIYILEPVWSAIFAHLYLGELLHPKGYLGGSLIVAGALINTWVTTRPRPAAAAPASAVEQQVAPRHDVRQQATDAAPEVHIGTLPAPATSDLPDYQDARILSGRPIGPDEPARRYATARSSALSPSITMQIEQMRAWVADAFQRQFYTGTFLYSYAGKANDAEEVLRTVLAAGVRYEASNAMEVLIVHSLWQRNLLHPGRYILCTGPKDDRYMKAIVALREAGCAGIVPILDTTCELETLLDRCSVPLLLGVRERAAWQPAALNHTDALPPGLTADEIALLIDQLAETPHRLVVYYAAPGNPAEDVDGWMARLDVSAKNYCRLHQQASSLRAFHFGGHMPTMQEAVERAFDYPAFLERLTRVMAGTCAMHDLPHANLIGEFGRYTVALPGADRVHSDPVTQLGKTEASVASDPSPLPLRLRRIP